MHKNQHGTGAVVIVIALAIIGLSGFATWYVLQNKDSGNESKRAGTTTETIQQPFSLTEDSLPTGWTIENRETIGSSILLKNDSNKCFVQVTYTTDTTESNSPDIDHNKQTIDAIKSKGYNVEESKGTITVVTPRGEKQITSQVLKVTGFDNPLFQKYAYITKSDSYTEVLLSCSEDINLKSAQDALLAIKLNKY